jgi:tRNA pseudouridine38-40 synthase
VTRGSAVNAAMRRPSGDEDVRENVPVRYRARVEYDGTDYAGFQVQPGARTVQGELEAALATISGGSRVRVVAAGRTDAGVHAIGQVIAFTDPKGRQASELARALDALLPEDVAIREVRRVPAGYHPRHAARYREYRYTVWNGPRSPLRERFALGVRDPLDTAAMERAGSVLVGRHDFSAFGASHRQPVRTVHSVRVRRNGSLVTIDIAADAFLRQMVRRIVAVLLEVGHGRTNEEAVAEALASRQPALKGATAPAKGLCLKHVALGPMRARATSTRRRPGAADDRQNGER